MEGRVYRVEKIEGEYAYLRCADFPDEEPLFIAMALLPPGTDEGMKLSYVNFEFEII